MPSNQDEVSGKGGTIMQFRSGVSVRATPHAATTTWRTSTLRPAKMSRETAPFRKLRLAITGTRPKRPCSKTAWALTHGYLTTLRSFHRTHLDTMTRRDSSRGLLPNATGDIINDDGTTASVTVPAMCFRNVIRVGAKSYYETNQDLALSMSTRINPPQTVSPQLDLTTHRPSLR